MQIIKIEITVKATAAADEDAGNVVGSIQDVRTAIRLALDRSIPIGAGCVDLSEIVTDVDFKVLSISPDPEVPESE